MITRRKILSVGVQAAALASSGALFLTSRSSSAQSSTFDYYISPTGSDAHPGTNSQPWAITAIETKKSLIGGKRIGLLPGTYYLADYKSLGSSGGDGAYINVFSGGTASSPTVIESVVPQAAIITNERSNGTLEGNHYASLWIDGSAPYVQLRNMRFTRSGGLAVWVRGSHNLIEGCQFDDFDGSRIGINGGYNPGAIRHKGFGRFSTIRNCLFQNLLTGGGVIQSAVGPVYDYQDIVIEYCTFSRCVPFYPKRNTGNYTFRYNFVLETTRYSGSETILLSFDVSDHRLVDDSGNFFADYGRRANLCHNNLFVVQNTRLTFDGYQTGQWANDVQFYNNTVVLNSSLEVGNGWWTRGNSSGSPDGGVTPPPQIPVSYDYYNNIFYIASTANLQAGWMYIREAYGFPEIARTWDFNGYSAFKYAMLRQGALTEYKSIEQFRALGMEANSLVVADPGFVNFGGNTAADYKLREGSPFRNRGRLGGVTTGALTDLGAWGGGAVQVGANFGTKPQPPTVIVS